MVRPEYAECLQEIEGDLSARAAREGQWSDGVVRQTLEALILNRSRAFGLDLEEKEAMLEQLFNRFRRLDRLQPLMEDQEITDVLINGCQQVYVEKNGCLMPAGIAFEDERQVLELIQRVCDQVNRQVNQANPMVDARLPDGSRIGAVLPPVALDGPVLAIRKFAAKSFSLEELAAQGSLPEAVAEKLARAVRERRSIFISGGTGSGKTTLLNTLANLVPAGERIVTVEDAAELKIAGQSNVVRLEARPPNTEGQGEVTLRQLVRMALRLRPDRIIVGEVRGGEALDMLQAMNTGHRGAMSSGHANSAADMLERLETMAMMAGLGLPAAAIRRQIGAALDLVVHLERLPDGRRQVAEVIRVVDWSGLRPEIKRLYERDGKGET